MSKMGKWLSRAHFGFINGTVGQVLSVLFFNTAFFLGHGFRYFGLISLLFVLMCVFNSAEMNMIFSCSGTR